MSKWMLYGANGYTGELIAEAAAAAGERPVLAGRRREAIEPLAERYGFESAIFDLDDADRVAAELEVVDAVLGCAGPFSRTAAPMLAGCLRSRTHYLDITGEIAVFERCRGADDGARASGIVVMPGVGFDVVPSDCLAASLAAALPGARELELAIYGGTAPSRGTARTALEGMGQAGGAARIDGEITTVPLAWKTAEIAFRDRRRAAVSIPWGDIATAHQSTGIPNIVVYMALPRRWIRALELARPLRPVLGLGPVQALIRGWIDRRIEGPDEEQRRTIRAQLWGRVSGEDGAAVEGTLETPEGYRLTAMTALESVRRVARGDVAPGAHTPSTAFGAGYITEFEGCDLRVGEPSPPG
jgi:short subunit dehydrogenase-like uncharacterized protein